jgi:hypothetical protein
MARTRIALANCSCGTPAGLAGVAAEVGYVGMSEVFPVLF